MATSQDKISTASFDEVSKAVFSVCDLNGLENCDKLELRRKLGFEADSYGSFTYYSSDSVMDVRELLIIFTDNEQVLSQTKEKLNDYVNEKHKLFENYAPEQSELLSSHLLTEKKGYLLFYVGDEKEKVLSAFSEKV